MSAAMTTTPLVPFARAAEPGRSFWYMGSLMSFIADRDDTGGQFAFFEVTSPKGDGPPLHIHRDTDESLYIIEGVYTFLVGDERIEAPAGTFVFLPRGIPHTFQVASETARALGIVTPGGFEGYFKAMGEPARELVLPAPPQGAPDIARMTALSAKYGADVVGPPP